MEFSSSFHLTELAALVVPFINLDLREKKLFPRLRFNSKFHNWMTKLVVRSF